MTFFAKFRYRHVGTVESICQPVDSNGDNSGAEKRAYWNLSENGFGSRKSTYFGPQHGMGSPLHFHQTAKVAAWVNGGAAPVGMDETAAYAPSTPKKKGVVLQLVRPADE